MDPYMDPCIVPDGAPPCGDADSANAIRGPLDVLPFGLGSGFILLLGIGLIRESADTDPYTGPY